MTTTTRTRGRRERLALVAALGATLAVSAPAIASAAPHGGVLTRHILPVRSWHPAPVQWHPGGHYNNTGSTGSGTTIPPRAPWHPAPAPHPAASQHFLQVIFFLLRGWGFHF